MSRKPGWLPDLDVGLLSDIIQENLQDLPDIPVGDFLSVSQGPAAVALGTVLGALTGEKAVESARELDVRIQKFVEEGPDDRVYLSRIAAGFALLLPDGEILRDAALGARDDPEKLREFLRKYHEEEGTRRQIDEAVQRVLTGDIEDLESELKDCFNTSNVEAAQAMLLDFRDLIEGQQVHQVLKNTLQIQTQLGDIDTELQRTRQKLLKEFDERLHLDLRDEGFFRLTPAYFDRDPIEFEPALLSGFSLVEVRAGYPIERKKAEESSSVSEELVDQLRDGEDRTIVGAGGSGKSTVCKRVACQWYDDPETGPVFYRESGSAAAFESVGTLLTTIQDADGHILVVVEDAVRREAQSIYEVVAECRQLSDVEVSFLFDARRDELSDVDLPADLEMGIQDRIKRVGSGIELYELPEVDIGTCERLVENFKQVTGSSVSRSPSSILSELDPVVDEGRIIHLVYFLPFEETVEDVGLHGDVVNKFKIITDPSVRTDRYAHLDRYDQDLVEDVALLIHILNATRLGIFPELVHSLGHIYGNDVDIHDQIEDIRTDFAGWMIHETSSSFIPHSTHEVWSIMYLRELVAREDTTDGRRRRTSPTHRQFSRCVNSVFALFENDELEESLRQEFGNSFAMRPLDEAPQITAYMSAAAIFDLGTRWPVLTGLFESTDRSRVELPSSPPDIEPYCINQRGLMFLARRSPSGDRDDVDAADAEFQRVLDHGEDTDASHQQLTSEASALGNLGNIEIIRGNIDKAEEYHRRDLEKEKELNRKWGIAAAYGSLGVIYQHRGELDKAKEYHEKAVEIERSIGELQGVAETLSNLGAVEVIRSNFDEAENYLLEGKQIAERAGYRRIESGMLMNLSRVASGKGDFDLAVERIQESLNIAREIGDTEAELSALINKADLLVRTDRQEEAEEDLEYALELAREIDDFRSRAKANGLLGIIARERGELGQAVKYAERGVELAREINDISTEADCLRDLGQVKTEMGDIEEGLQDLADAIKIFNDIGDRQSKAGCLTTYGWALMGAMQLDQAERYLEQALGIAHDVGDKDTRARCFGNLGLISVLQNDLERAKKFYRVASREFLKIGMYHWAARSIEILVSVLEELGEGEAAERWQERAEEQGLEIDPNTSVPAPDSGFVVEDEEDRGRTDKLIKLFQDSDVDYIPIGRGAGIFMPDGDYDLEPPSEEN